MENLIKNYSNLSPEKQKLVEVMLKEKGVEISDILILPQKRNGKPLPVSFAQRRLWFLEQFEPGSSLYIIPIGIKIKGNLNFDALNYALSKLIERHEILRTSFDSIDGEVFQIIHDPMKINIKKIDTTKNEENREVNQIILNEIQKPFDLKQAPLFRVVVIKLNIDEHVLLVPMHHIISDNWSTGIFVGEFLSFYKKIAYGETTNLDPLPIQYADFSVWQQERFRKNLYEEQTNYWVKNLANSNSVLDIITDYQKPVVQSYKGSFELFEIPNDIYSKLIQLAKDTDTTLFMILIAVFQIMLYRYTNQSDLNIGTPIANRNRSEIEKLIGFFINTLVIRNDLSGNPSFKKLLKKTRTIALEAYQNQDVPFEDIVDKLKLERDMSHTALFQAMFVLNNAPVEKLELPDVKFEILDIDNGTTKFDLILSLTETNNILKGKFEFNTELFKRFTIRQLIKTYNKLLLEITSNPDAKIDELQLADESDLSVLIGDSYELVEDINVYKLIENIASQHPDKKAISMENESLTYSEVIRRINKLANLLILKGIVKDDIVSVYLDRKPGFIISMLSIMKVGATYLPLDINYPKERLNYLIEDSKSKYIVTNKDLKHNLNGLKDKAIIIDNSENQSDNFNHSIQIKSKDRAYIIYTSGSTGKPKGVEVSHKSLVNHCLIMQKHFGLTSDDKELEFAAFNFDASIEQILVPLISGAELFLRGNEIWSAQEFTKIIKEQSLTIINPPTVFWEELTRYWYENPSEAPSNQLKLCIAGGDEMKPDLIRLWMNSPMKEVKLLNAYGPTEGVITVSTAEINKIKTDKLFRTPIGKPLMNRIFYIIDKNLNILPKGFPGELCISGEVLANGYLNRPDITNKKFVKDLFAADEGEVMYRTGDLVKMNEFDDIEFIGRIDSQIKIRGFRIELGEIESTIRAFDFIEDVVVTDFTENGDKFLVAYVIPKKTDSFDEKSLFSNMKDIIPDYMIPSSIIQIEKFPLTPSGKLDKKALPKPVGSRPKPKSEFVLPRTETERDIAQIITDVLNVSDIGVFDNLFEIGGHSMKIMQIVSRIKEKFDVDLPLRTIFEDPTIEGISKAILNIQIQSVEQNTLEKLLDEIESLSEDELKHLL